MNKGLCWKISNSISILFVITIGLIWFYTTKKYNPNVNQLTNQAEVESFLSDNLSTLPDNIVPTGVFIQSLKFNNSTEVNFTGYIWQIYPSTKYEGVLGEDIPVGFVLPEVVESGDNIEPTFAYREIIEGNREVIGWYFEATLKQKFDYSKYPFDHKTVWIRFWSSDYDRDTILVPDFYSYKATGIGDTFGYDKNIVLGHWNLLETFYDYQFQDYDTGFGIYEGGYLENQPELYYNVIIKRRFINSFVIYILPVFIIACLIFATMMMITRNESQSSIFGMNTSGVIGVCSGLFFVVLLSQVQIREQFAGSSIVYVEYFYPLLYIALLGVSVNSFLFSLENRSHNPMLNWIDYEDNLIPKLIYWPVLLGSATVVSALVLLPDRTEAAMIQGGNQALLPTDVRSGEIDLLSINFDLEDNITPTEPIFHPLASSSYTVEPQPLVFSDWQGATVELSMQETTG